MSDSTEPDSDAWAEACAEDLAAEQSRRKQQHDPGPSTAAGEFGRLVDSVAQKISELTTPLAGAAGESAGRRAAESTAEQWTRQLAESAKAVLVPVVERNPKVLEHLTAAGSELLSAYQAAVTGAEQRWTKEEAAGIRITRDDETPEKSPEPAADSRDEPKQADGRDEPKQANGRDDDDPPGTERIDLD